MCYHQKKLSKKRLTALLLSFSIAFLFLFPMGPKPVSADEPFTPSPAPLIIEQFTGGWCGYCPLASAYLQIAKLTMFPNDEFAVSAYHNGDPMANSDSEQRENVYNVDAFPTLVFGGSTIVRGAGDYRNTIAAAIASKHYIADISIIGSKDPKQYEIKVRANEPFGKRKINLVTVITEDWVNIQTRNTDAFQRHVMRNMPYGATGRSLILKEGEIYSETRKFALQTKAWDQVEILAFLQDMDTKEIVGSGLYKYNPGSPALYYWGEEPSYQLVPVTTSKNKVKFSVANATDLTEVFVKVLLDNSIYGMDDIELVGAEVSPDLKNISTISVDTKIGEIRVKFSEPVNGNATLFIATLRFKKKAKSIFFQIIRFAAVNSQNQMAPFELIDLRILCGFEVKDNPYDLDVNLSIDEGDVAVILQKFGFTKKDREYNKKCDFNSDGRIDIEDLTELLYNLD